MTIDVQGVLQLLRHGLLEFAAGGHDRQRREAFAARVAGARQRGPGSRHVVRTAGSRRRCAPRCRPAPGTSQAPRSDRRGAPGAASPPPWRTRAVRRPSRTAAAARVEAVVLHRQAVEAAQLRAKVPVVANPGGVAATRSGRSRPSPAWKTSTGLRPPRSVITWMLPIEGAPAQYRAFAVRWIEVGV